jgi:hypothetical protein
MAKSGHYGSRALRVAPRLGQPSPSGEFINELWALAGEFTGKIFSVVASLHGPYLATAGYWIKFAHAAGFRAYPWVKNQEIWNFQYVPRTSLLAASSIAVVNCARIKQTAEEIRLT